MPSAASRGCQGGAARGGAAPPLRRSAARWLRRSGFSWRLQKERGKQEGNAQSNPRRLRGEARWERVRAGAGPGRGRESPAPPLPEVDLAAALSLAGNRVQSLNNCGALLRPARFWTPRHPHCARKHGPSPRSGHSRNRP
ncbi:PREDICTED: uncharacterized protein LOC105580981 [Cercocebus atys]|uniref:uncharacterized protein LOC105580981 n=1 Tax=Cercocebus atys TaxID=9531 RepID=UPI0005F3FC07|nr:PREDICTED: uncharacterized protein LOC105580981 [Cercocebus atys]